MQRQEIISIFTKRHIIAVIVIAVLASIGMGFFSLTLKNIEKIEMTIDRCTKQKILSQRIVSLCHHYHRLTHSNNRYVEIKQTKSALLIAMDEMRYNANTLALSYKNNENSVMLSDTLYEFYHGEMQLKVKVDRYLEITERFIRTENKADAEKLLDELVSSSDTLLNNLDHVTLEYKNEGEKSIAQTYFIEIAVWILLVLTLLIEVMIVFQPMNNKIRELFNKLIENHENLENQIKIRTLSMEQANIKLKHLASHDPLTGLKNRLDLERNLEALIDHYHQNSIPYAVVMFDIDWFKKINDNYGHDTGDFVLCEVARILSENIRNGDSVYRAGGEEFVIVFNRIDKAEAVDKSNKIRSSIEEHVFVYKDIEIRLTISGGVYHPEIIEVSNVQEVLKFADTALYRAKRLGRNQVSEAYVDVIGTTMPLAPSKTIIKAGGVYLDEVHFADYEIERISGYSSEAFTNAQITLRQIIHKDDLDLFDKLSCHDSFSTTLRLIHPSGCIKIVRADFTNKYDNEWEIEIQDPIALAKSVEDKMVLENFEAMLSNTDDYIYFKDKNHVFTAGSKTLVELTNVDTKEELIGKTDYEVFPKEFADKYFILEKKVFSGDVDVAREVQPYLDNNGHPGWVDNRKYPIKNTQGEIIGLFGIARVLYGDSTSSF